MRINRYTKTSALLKQPEAWSKPVMEVSTMIRVKQSSHGVELGKHYGKWEVIGPPFSAGTARNFHALCRCDCGRMDVVQTNNLASGRSPQCRSCQVRSAKTKHGFAQAGAHEPLYDVWVQMRQRCTNANNSHWQYYGGKGVRVCDEWQDYEAFRRWAFSNGYEPGLTIERKRSNGNYEPENCEWITSAENNSRAHKGKRINK
jgi:hypothetical protein